MAQTKWNCYYVYTTLLHSWPILTLPKRKNVVVFVSQMSFRYFEELHFFKKVREAN